MPADRTASGTVPRPVRPLPPSNNFMPAAHRPAPQPLLVVWLSALLAATAPLPAEPIPSEPDVGTHHAAGVVEARGDTVEVEPTADDRDIDARITGILDATGRYTDLAVRVNDGVVFITGTTGRESHRELAGSLARKVSDVAAVVNQIEVDHGPWWDLSPAWDEARNLARDAVQAVPLLLLALLLGGFTLGVARPLSRLLARPLGGLTDSVLVQNVLRKLIYVLLLVVGLYLFLRVSGLTRIALTLISGTGLVGLVLGFAFRDIAENFLASLLISIQKPFRLGDVISVDGHTGLVQAVTTRGTLLVDFDGNHIQIANSTVYKNTLKNFTANPKVRLTCSVGVGYDAPITRSQSVVMGVLEAHDAVLSDPAPQVLVDGLGSSTVNLKAYFWIDGGAYSGVKVKSAVLRQTVHALTGAGISMPDDAREVVFPQGVPVQMQPEHTPPTETARPACAEDDACEVASAARGEDGLGTEVGDLQRQAAEARRPDEGASVI